MLKAEPTPETETEYDTALETIRRSVRADMVPDYWCCPCGCGAKMIRRWVPRSEAEQPDAVLTPEEVKHRPA